MKPVRTGWALPAAALGLLLLSAAPAAVAHTVNATEVVTASCSDWLLNTAGNPNVWEIPSLVVTIESGDNGTTTSYAGSLMLNGTAYSNATFVAHGHTLRCTGPSVGPHWMKDLGVPYGEDANEIWGVGTTGLDGSVDVVDEKGFLLADGEAGINPADNSTQVGACVRGARRSSSGGLTRGAGVRSALYQSSRHDLRGQAPVRLVSAPPAAAALRPLRRLTQGSAQLQPDLCRVRACVTGRGASPRNRSCSPSLQSDARAMARS